MVRLLIVAEVKLYRDGLAQVLERNPDLQVVGTAADVDEAVREVARAAVDVVLLDVSRSGAIAAVRTLRQIVPHVHIVALALNESREDEVLECIQAGASGYVPPNGTLEDLAATVQRIERGELICPPRVTLGLAKRLTKVTGGDPEGVTRLTQRERQIAGLIDHGFSNKEIGQALHIEIATVKNHIHNLMEKLCVHRRQEAVARLRHTVLPALVGVASMVMGV